MICNHGKLMHIKGQRTLLWQGKGSWEDNSKQLVAFHWLSPCQERRADFLLPIGICYVTRPETSQFCHPILFHVRFLFIVFFFFVLFFFFISFLLPSTTSNSKCQIHFFPPPIALLKSRWMWEFPSWLSC